MTTKLDPARRRSHMRQSLSIDTVDMTATYARACSVSPDYILVRVPLVRDGKGLDYDTSKLSEQERRFVIDNVTPREHDVANGKEPQKFDRSR